MQEQREENRMVAKSRPTAMNLTSSVPTNSSSVNSPTASRETWCKRKSKFQSRRSVEFSRMAKGCSTVHKHKETCTNRQGSEVSESAGRICRKHRETCSTRIQRIPRKPRNSRNFRKLRNRRQNLATSFPYITRLCASHGESLLDRETDL